MPRKKTTFSQFGNQTVPSDEHPDLVKGVFSNVSTRYDLMNDLMSGGTHRVWKNVMVDWLAPRENSLCLDLAGGTGDIARRILKCTPNSNCYVVDLTQEMLKVGKEKKSKTNELNQLFWVSGDATKLPFPNKTFDYCTVAFGIRNFKDIDLSLVEIKRVLKLGGRLLILEFSHVQNDNLRKLYDAYSFRIIPQLGNLVLKDRESYQYLVESIRNFPTQEELVNKLRNAGFQEVKYRNLSMGIVAIHSGWKL